jgi:threonine dehydratase
VLAGVQVPEPERARFAEHLAKLGYTHVNETENAAYRLFLQAQ